MDRIYEKNNLPGDIGQLWNDAESWVHRSSEGQWHSLCNAINHLKQEEDRNYREIIRADSDDKQNRCSVSPQEHTLQIFFLSLLANIKESRSESQIEESHYTSPGSFPSNRTVHSPVEHIINNYNAEFLVGTRLPSLHCSFYKCLFILILVVDFIR